MIAVRRRFIDWATRSFPAPDHAVSLTRRRIFILPTAYGVMLGLLLVLMLLAALNYDNNLALLLTFLLGGMAVNAIYFSYRNLAGIRLAAVPQQDVFAGQNARFRIAASNSTSFDRYGLVLIVGERTSAAVDVDRNATATLETELSTKARGILQPGRFTIASRAPLGLFRTWSWQQLISPIWVYPAPVASTEPPLHPSGGSENGVNRFESGDEFDRLRPYREGDPVGHIAWKKQAKTDEPMVKQFDGSVSREEIYSWHALQGSEPELRLSQLCFWICQAEREGRRYGLILPGRSVPPGRGEQHRRSCLQALAGF